MAKSQQTFNKKEAEKKRQKKKQEKEQKKEQKKKEQEIITSFGSFSLGIIESPEPHHLPGVFYRQRLYLWQQIQRVPRIETARDRCRARASH